MTRPSKSNINLPQLRLIEHVGNRDKMLRKKESVLAARAGGSEWNLIRDNARRNPQVDFGVGREDPGRRQARGSFHSSRTIQSRDKNLPDTTGIQTSTG